MYIRHHSQYIGAVAVEAACGLRQGHSGRNAVPPLAQHHSSRPQVGQLFGARERPHRRRRRLRPQSNQQQQLLQRHVCHELVLAITSRWRQQHVPPIPGPQRLVLVDSPQISKSSRSAAAAASAEQPAFTSPVTGLVESLLVGHQLVYSGCQAQAQAPRRLLERQQSAESPEATLRRGGQLVLDGARDAQASDLRRAGGHLLVRHHLLRDHWPRAGRSGLFAPHERLRPQCGAVPQEVLRGRLSQALYSHRDRLL